MFKKFLNNQSKTIASAALIVGAASLISRLLGVLRDRVLAGEFGAGVELDIYYAAFRIPDLIFNLLVLGALSAGFIPVFTGYLKNKEKAWRLVNILVNVLLVVLILISGLFILIAPWLVKIITPGFTPEQASLTVAMTRIMFLSPLLLAISGIFGGILQSVKQFFIYSLAPILYNVGIIFGALFLVPIWQIYGLAWGVVLGAALHMLIQLPAVMVLGYRYWPIIDLKEPGFVKIIKIMGPRILGLMTSQINFLVVTIIGSTLAVGSITIFNLANNLQSFPLGVFGISFAIAAFPTLSELAKKKQAFIQTLSATIRQILFLIVPASALLIVLRAQIVRIILGTGRFDWQDTVLTLETLSLFAFSLFAQALIILLARAFYALEDSKTPFAAGLVSAFANIILAFMLIEKMGVLGLALAFSLASILNFVILILVLHYRVGKLDGQKISAETAKIIVATFMLTLSAQAIKFIVEPYAGTETFLGVTIQALTATAAGLLVYLVVCWILRVEELQYFVGVVQKRFIRKAPAIVEVIENE